MKTSDMKNLDKSLFVFSRVDDKIHDTKFSTKPIGYYKDAMMRFTRNKVSMIAAVIILILLVFSVSMPWFSNYTPGFKETYYQRMYPKNSFLSNFGIATARYNKKVNYTEYTRLCSIGIGYMHGGDGGTFALDDGIGHDYAAVYKVKNYDEEDKTYQVVIDQYAEIGFRTKELTPTEFANIWKYQQETGIQVLFPVVDKNSGFAPTTPQYLNAPSVWYRVDKYDFPVYQDGKLIDNYARYTISQYDDIVGKQVEPGDLKYYDKISSATNIIVRVWYAHYFEYENGFAPEFLFGTNADGRDIAIRLAKAIQISLILGISVAVSCFVIGAIIGAIEGYYGGAVDMIIERILDIISGIPMLIVLTLFKIRFVDNGNASTFTVLLIAFVATGWLGTAGLVRAQFYRFKHHEYILAARTLGAGDARIMFKHIFPNTLGTIITSSALAIPGVIGSEATLTYLLPDLIKSETMSSIGLMLSEGQAVFDKFPHVILFPSLAICLLMISFNLFGNGLRDAFNPALRGTGV